MLYLLRQIVISFVHSYQFIANSFWIIFIFFHTPIATCSQYEVKTTKGYNSYYLDLSCN